MRLNKYLAKSGVASRRKSDELIKMATTTVNNEIVLDPAYEVNEIDEIRKSPNPILGKLNHIHHS